MMVGGHLPDLAQIAEGERLAADEVRRRLHPDERDPFRPVPFDRLLELLHGEVPAERLNTLRVQRLVRVDLGHGGPRQFHVCLGCGEVVVHEYHIARFHEDLGQQVFRGAALVHRDRVAKSQNLLDRVGQPVEALASGIGVIGHHHRRQLGIAHGVRAAVGEHVEEDIPGPQEERIVARVTDGLKPPGDWHQAGLLHDPDLVHLHRDDTAAGQPDVHCNHASLAPSDPAASARRRSGGCLHPRGGGGGLSSGEGSRRSPQSLADARLRDLFPVLVD